MILIVDDEIFVSELLKRKLMGEGYEVRVADNEYDAIQVMKSWGEMRVLITDLHLKEGKGMNILQWALENRPDVHRIVVSAHTYEEWLSEGGDQVLCQHAFKKPLDVQKNLLPLLKSML